MPTNTMKEFREKAVKEFDKEFGKNGPDRNCDSIGRSAGCDDCLNNIEINV